MDFKKLITTQPYDFLRTDPHLGDRVILLTLGGSHAYGTNTDTSDVDFRGCALNSPSELLGFGHFDQFIDNATDTTIYSFNRIIQLLLSCSPGVVEMLGCRSEHYVILTYLGRMLVDNRQLFLSQRIFKTFGGYAIKQLRRIENAFVDKNMPRADQERCLMRSLESAVSSFKDRFPAFNEGDLSLRIADSDKDDLECEVVVDFKMSDIPIRQFKNMLEALASIQKNAEKLNRRSRQMDNSALAKDAMHLVRLYLEGVDILEKGDIITYQEENLGLLMGIRRGEFQKEDGTFIPEFYEMIHDLDQRLTYAKENTSLPPAPDTEAVEELAMEINWEALHA